MARETGYGILPLGVTDPLHLVNEPEQWNAEFPSQIDRR